MGVFPLQRSCKADAKPASLVQERKLDVSSRISEGAFLALSPRSATVGTWHCPRADAQGRSRSL